MTNAARLLPQGTTHPFWVENRLREEQFYKIYELVEKVQMQVRHYENYFHFPSGLKCCAELWENRLADEKNGVEWYADGLILLLRCPQFN